MVVASSCFTFRALIKLNHASTNLKNFCQNSTSLLYLPIPSSAETRKIVNKEGKSIFLRLS